MLSIATVSMLLSGLAGCGADNQAADFREMQLDTTINRQGGLGGRNDLQGQVDHDGGFFNQGRQPGEVTIGEDRPRGFGTDYGQGRAGGFFGLDGDRQGQHGAGRLAANQNEPTRTQGSTIDRIEEMDGVRQVRARGDVIEIQLNDDIDNGKVRDIEREAKRIAANHTVRVIR